MNASTAAIPTARGDARISKDAAEPSANASLCRGGGSARLRTKNLAAHAGRWSARHGYATRRRTGDINDALRFWLGRNPREM